MCIRDRPRPPCDTLCDSLCPLVRPCDTVRPAAPVTRPVPRPVTRPVTRPCPFTSLPLCASFLELGKAADIVYDWFAKHQRCCGTALDSASSSYESSRLPTATDPQTLHLQVSGASAFVTQMPDQDPVTCAARNVHNRSAADVAADAAAFAPPPPSVQRLDCSRLLGITPPPAPAAAAAAARGRGRGGRAATTTMMTTAAATAAPALPPRMLRAVTPPVRCLLLERRSHVRRRRCRDCVSRGSTCRSRELHVCCRSGASIRFDRRFQSAVSTARLSCPHTAERPARCPAHSALPTICLLYTSPSPRDRTRSRMPSSA